MKSVLLSSVIALIDERIKRIINSILHHPAFQALEASWCGVHQLVQLQHEQEQRAHILLLHLDRNELKQDVLGVMEFDHSETFEKIYGDHFDTPGGHPLGLWIGDYTFSIDQAADLSLLQCISDIAAAAFCPFVSMASLLPFGEDYAQNWHRIEQFDFLSSKEYQAWQNLRTYQHARFVTLLLPRVLLREPYHDTALPCAFREETCSNRDLLWGNTAYFLAEVIMRAYFECNWFDFIQGEPFAGQTAGLMAGHTSRSHTLESRYSKLATELYITEAQERSLNEQGFTALFSKQYDKAMIFYYIPTIAKQVRSVPTDGVSSGYLDHLLPYLLCVCRFAHYLKIICREKIGSLEQTNVIQNDLNNWLADYCASNDDLAFTSFGRYPLKKAEVEVSHERGNTNHYFLRVALTPRVNLQGIEVTFILFSNVKHVGRHY